MVDTADQFNKLGKKVGKIRIIEVNGCSDFKAINNLANNTNNSNRKTKIKIFEYDCEIDKKKLLDLIRLKKIEVQKLEQNLSKATNDPSKFSTIYKELKLFIINTRNELIKTSKEYGEEGKNEFLDELTNMSKYLSQVEDDIRQKKKQVKGLTEDQENLMQSMIIIKGQHKELTDKMKASIMISNYEKQQEKEEIKEEVTKYIMEIEALLNFKTNKCDDVKCIHNDPSSSSYEKHHLLISCDKYHNINDRRRNPLQKTKDSTTFYYSNKLICIVCFSGQHNHGLKCFYSLNYIEYYYHPLNYKKFPCETKKCERKFCYSYHSANEKIVWEKLAANHKFSEHLIHCRKPKYQTKYAIDPMNINLLANLEVDDKSSKPDEPSKHIENDFIVIGLKKPENMNGTIKIREAAPPIISQDNNNDNTDNKVVEKNISYVKSPHNINITSKYLNNLMPNLDNIQYLNQNQEKIPLLDCSKITSFLKNKPMPKNQIDVEDDTFEYKNFNGPKFKDIEYQKIYKILCSFLNTKGGTLYIGVDELSQMVIGTYLDNKDYDEFKLRLVKTLKENFSPTVSDDLFSIKRIPVINVVNEVIKKQSHKWFVITITIHQDLERLYYIRKYIDNQPFYIAYARQERVVKPLTGEELNIAFSQKKKQKEINIMKQIISKFLNILV